MKSLILGLTVFTALLVSRSLLAQEPISVEQAVSNSPAIDSEVQTETMWFYLQELRRYDDPRTVVRRKAEKKADQRRMRLAAQKWYGYSAGRPLASHTPFMGTYSSTWVGNGKDSFQWVGSGFATTAVRVDLSRKIR